jgi:ribosomal protein L40E
VKAYLGVIQSNTIMQEEKEPEIQQEPISMKEEKSMVKDDKFYCRYCGRENEADAVFCEKCGKKLK